MWYKYSPMVVLTKTFDPASVLGLLAGVLTTVAYLPQVVRTWKRKSAGDLSLSMVVCTTLGVFLWFVYGLTIRSMPVIVANSVTFVLTSTVLVLRLRYGKRGGRAAGQAKRTPVERL